VIASTIALTLLVAPAPTVQRPRTAEPTTPTSEVAPSEAPPIAPTEPVAPAEPDAAVEPPDTESTPPVEPTTDTEPPKPTGEMVHVAEGNAQSRAPYYDPADIDALRKRHGLKPMPKPDARKVKWRCFIADPLCGFNVEVQAMGAVAGRFKQGDVRTASARKWASGRAQYDVWVNIPVLTENSGRTRYTRMTLGPKAGAMFSDTGDTWGNLGMVARYWFGRGRFAPMIEFTSALAFKIARRQTVDLPPGEKPHYEMQRGPVGITGDIAFGFGGFGALVFGGQYDSPLARQDIPGEYRTAAAGMLYFGFRGNILWGAPAAAALATHGLTQRYGRESR
jgi:hypothetical protein